LGKAAFLDNPENDGYRCPAGHASTWRFDTREKDRHIRDYATSAGRACPLPPKWTRHKAHRRITRWVHEDLLEAMQQRVTAKPEKVRLRQRTVEHPFGTIKRGRDQGDFLTRGRASVRAAMRLTVLATTSRESSRSWGSSRASPP
jgi:hypothetical protein